MEKNWKIELSDQVQMFVWTMGLVVIVAFMIWDRIDGEGRSFEKDGVAGLFFLTNLNIVLNRITFRNAMRKNDADT